MANKSRILYLLRYLQENSDEDHPVTTAEIRKALADKGCPVTVETLRNDIVMLQETGFNMYDDGKEADVILRCRCHMIDHMVDWFGKDVEPENITEHSFNVTVRDPSARRFIPGCWDSWAI